MLFCSYGNERGLVLGFVVLKGGVNVRPHPTWVGTHPMYFFKFLTSERAVQELFRSFDFFNFISRAKPGKLVIK